MQIYKDTHPDWHPILKVALATMNQDYIETLQKEKDWLPGSDQIFAAFNQPLSQLRFILLGESPYPRAESANGFAFWDNAVDNLWSEKGLSTRVNRATSLRNFIKMLLVARGDLQKLRSQEAIAALPKTAYWQTCKELFQALNHRGFLLLNASLVYREGEVNHHAKQWQPFLGSVLLQLAELKLPIKLLLFGKIAAKVPHTEQFTCLASEHPYNVSFIENASVLDFFKPLDVLNAYE